MSDIAWRRSSYTDNETCVELAATDTDVLLRNSNRPDAGTLRIDRSTFAALLTQAKDGRLDHLR